MFICEIRNGALKLLYSTPHIHVLLEICSSKSLSQIVSLLLYIFLVRVVYISRWDWTPRMILPADNGSIDKLSQYDGDFGAT